MELYFNSGVSTYFSRAKGPFIDLIYHSELCLSLGIISRRMMFIAASSSDSGMSGDSFVFHAGTILPLLHFILLANAESQRIAVPGGVIFSESFGQYRLEELANVVSWQLSGKLIAARMISPKKLKTN